MQKEPAGLAAAAAAAAGALRALGETARLDAGMPLPAYVKTLAHLRSATPASSSPGRRPRSASPSRSSGARSSTSSSSCRDARSSSGPSPGSPGHGAQSEAMRGSPHTTRPSSTGP
jgi:hypothetical protein